MDISPGVPRVPSYATVPVDECSVVIPRSDGRPLSYARFNAILLSLRPKQTQTTEEDRVFIELCISACCACLECHVVTLSVPKIAFGFRENKH